MPDEPQDPTNPKPPEGDASEGISEARLQQLSARVPEHVARGVFSTGAIVLAGQAELILDFVARLTQPHQVVARVVLPLPVVPAIIATLRDNIDKYQRRFGPIPELPKPNIDRRPTLQEIYDELRLPDAMLSGAYANALIIGHTPAEFALDFVTNVFPRSVIASRVYLSAPHLPRFTDSLTNTYEQHLRRQVQRQQQLPPPPPPPKTEGENPPTEGPGQANQ